MGEDLCTEPRTIALFPGAFRPPHVDHYEVVRTLQERSDVDEVVVIIANRNRQIPKTTKALGTGVAEAVWSIYIADDPKVRVETATASGVAQSLSYVDLANPGDRLLFVVGSEDHATRTRFSKLRDYDLERKGITVEVVSGPPSLVNVRATDLRAMLGEGVRGRKAFHAALPSHLTEDQKNTVWTTCANSMIEQRDLDVQNVIEVLQANGMELAEPVTPTPSSEPTGNYRALRNDGVPVIIKCALDATSATGTRTPDRDRRQRLKTERLGAEVVCIGISLRAW